MALAHEIVDTHEADTGFSLWFYGQPVIARQLELWGTAGEILDYLQRGYTWCSCLRCHDTCYVTTAGYRAAMVQYNAPHPCREAPCPSPTN